MFFPQKTTPRGALTVLAVPILMGRLAEGILDAVVGPGVYESSDLYLGLAISASGVVIGALGFWWDRKEILLTSLDEETSYTIGGIARGPRLISMPLEIWGVAFVALGIYITQGG